MKTKSNVKSRKLSLITLVLLAVVLVTCGLFSMFFGSRSANAESNVLTDFSSGVTPANGEIVTNVDADGNGIVDTAYAWKIDPHNAKNGITFNTPLDLSGCNGIQIRMYVHWGTGFVNGDRIYFNYNTTSPANEWDHIFAFWGYIDEEYRPFVQDQWMTLTFNSKPGDAETLTALSVLALSNTATVYDDAFILIDSITALKAGSTVNGENVITEFAADQVSHTGKDWRFDLATDVDIDGNGVVEAADAWRVRAGAGTKTMELASAIDFSSKLGAVKGVQIRMYAHLGEITGDTNIEVQLNGTTVGHWSSAASGLYDSTRPIIQDQWITYTIAENFSLTSLSSIGFVFPSSGINYYQDAYILVDKVTTVENSAALDANVLTEFAADQVSHSGKGWRTDLAVDVDTNSDGVVDADNAWRVIPTQASQSISFANPLSLASGKKYIQFRMYVHWGQLDSSTGAENGKVTVYLNGGVVAYIGGYNWSGSIGNAFRPLIQDEWMTFTLETDTTSISSLGFDFNNNGVTAYSDASIYVDKITVLTASPAKEANVITEFAWDEMDYTGKGWRTDLVSDVDTDGNGVVEATNAWRAGVTQSGFSFAGSAITMTFPSAIDFSSKLGAVKGVQIRMYAHLGEITGDTDIEVQLNGTTVGHWSSAASVYYDSTRPIIQDQWITYTIAENFSLTSLSSIGFVFPSNGINYYQDAYILVDKVTTVENSAALDANVLTEFAADQVSHSGKGWRTDLAVDVDTNGDGVVDAENAWRIDTHNASSSITFANAIDISNIEILHIRAYIHWGEVGGGVPFILLTANGSTSHDFLYIDSFVQDEWFDWVIEGSAIADIKSIGSTLTGLTITTNANGMADVYDNAYILIDCISSEELKLPSTVTFVHGDGIANTSVTVNYGEKATAEESKKTGYTVTWCTDQNGLYPYDFNNEVTGNLTLYAKYTAIPYTVTFVHGNGIADEKVTVNYDDKATAAESQKDGYAVEWYADEACTKAYDFNTVITGDLTLYAKYSVLYTVTFVHGSNMDNDVVKIPDGNTVSPAASKQFGYTATWYTNAACTTLYDFNKGVTADLTLYAKYEVLNYEDSLIAEFTPADIKVVNKGGFGGAGTVSEITFTSGNGADSVLKANWETGWKDISIEFANKLPAEDVKTITIRYYAHLNESGVACGMWTSLSGYDLKWYDFDVQNQWVELTFSGDDITNMANSDGDIDGFIISINFNGTGASDAYFMLDSVTCQVSRRKVTFVHGNGIENEILKIADGENATPAGSKMLGYSVTWYTDANFVNPYDFNSDIIESITLYGKYEPINYEKGLVAEFAPEDAVLWTDCTGMPSEASGFIPDSNFSYVTNVDTNGDGVTDAQTAIKVEFSVQWQAFAVKLANSVDIEDVASITFRVYLDTKGVSVSTLWCGEASDYTDSFVPWAENGHPLNQWFDITVSSDEMLSKMAGADGKFDSFVIAAGFGAAPQSGTYMLLDKITYVTGNKVTFVYGGSTENKVVRVAIGDKVAPIESTIPGYSIVWCVDKDLKTPYDFDTVVTGDLTLYAKYVDAPHTVTFVHGEGIDDVTIYVTNGGKIMVAASKKEGYTVTWYTDAAFTNEYDFNTAVKNSLTLYAKYTLITYTVTFVHGDGIEDETAVVNYGENITAAASKKEGYSVKWYMDANLRIPYNFEKTVTADITLYAKYTANPYTVTFVHGNGIADEKISVGNGDTITAAAGKKEGYTVVWYTDAACTNEYDFNTVITADLTLYAEYTVIPYTVTFVHGESIANETATVNYGEKATAVAGKKEGYTVAWYTDAACTNKYDFNTAIKGDITLYAKYTVNTYTVTFVHGEGIANETATVNYGGKATAVAGKKEGYTIAWYTDAACTSEYDFNSAVTGDITLYAKYTVIPYTVTFVHGEGIANETVTVNYGGKATAAASKKEGYTVVWYTDAACTNKYDFNTAIKGDITLYAKYTAPEEPEKSGCSSAYEACSAMVISTVVIAALGCVIFVRKKRTND